nr:hypothetical protein [Trebouxia sp. A1-2]
MAKQIAGFRQFVIQDIFESYIGYSIKFFNLFREQTIDHLNNIIKQKYTLYQQNLDLEKMINFVESEVQIMKEERLLKEEKAKKRKNAITKKMRDSVNEN